jgi:AraC-like DNA-binding protein
MFLDIISVFVGFLSIGLGLFILYHKEQKSKANFYFIVILLFFGLIRVEFTLETLGIIGNRLYPLKLRASLGLGLVSLLYFFLHKLIKQQGASVKDLYYIMPTVFILLFIEFSTAINFVAFKYISLFYFSAYFIFILYLFRIYFFRKKLDFKTKKYLQSIKIWAIMILLIFMLIFILEIIILFNERNKIQIMQNFYKYSSLAWLFIFYYLLKNPIIIFGKQYLIKNIQINKKEDFLIWSLTALRKIEEKDLPLYKICMNNISNLIFEIKNLEDNEAITNKEALKIDFLAKIIRTPKSHLEFVFKYHCHFSTNDYVNLIKIKYALKLIDAGYLNTKTINSLVEKTLFNSRTTFFANFKKFMGMPITTYLNQTGITPEKYKVYLNRV